MFEPICSTTRSNWTGASEASKKTVQFIESGDFVTTSFRVTGQYMIEWLGMRPEAASVPSVAGLIVVEEYDLDLLVNYWRQHLLLALCRRRPKLWQTMNAHTTTKPLMQCSTLFPAARINWQEQCTSTGRHTTWPSLMAGALAHFPGPQFLQGTSKMKDHTIQTRPELASPVPSDLPSTPELQFPIATPVKASKENT